MSIDLSVGEPDFDTPAPVAQAGIQAIQKGMTRYPANIGIPSCAPRWRATSRCMSGGRAVNPDHIVVSSGSKQSIFNACFTLFGPKDKVLIPSPAWVSYPQIVHLCRAEPVMVPGDIEWGLKVSVTRPRAAYDKLVQGLILCSPCNPTGAVYTRAGAQGDRRVGPEARRSGSSPTRSTAGSTTATGPAPSFLDLPDELLERVVLIYRREQGVRDDRLADRRGAGPAAPGQGDGRAAVAHHHRRQPPGAVGGGDGLQRRAGRSRTSTKMVAAFRRRRDRLVARFRAEAPGVEFVEPHGAFYFFFRVDGIAAGVRVTGRHSASS